MNTQLLRVKYYDGEKLLLQDKNNNIKEYTKDEVANLIRKNQIQLQNLVLLPNNNLAYTVGWSSVVLTPTIELEYVTCIRNKAGAKTGYRVLNPITGELKDYQSKFLKLYMSVGQINVNGLKITADNKLIQVEKIVNKKQNNEDNNTDEITVNNFINKAKILVYKYIKYQVRVGIK